MLGWAAGSPRLQPNPKAAVVRDVEPVARRHRNRRLRRLENRKALLASFDVGVAPYPPSEDFYFSPLKVVEYLAAGLPVVHPRLGDLTEVVGDAGIAYDAEDSNGLAAALDRAVRDAELRRRCSAAARSRAQAFSWDATAAAVEGVAGAAIAKRSRAAR